MDSYSFGKLEHGYLKHFRHLDRDILNCFISRNFISKVGNKTFSGGTKVVFITFSPGVKGISKWLVSFGPIEFLARLQENEDFVVSAAGTEIEPVFFIYV